MSDSAIFGFLWYFASGRSFWAGLTMMAIASLLYLFLYGNVVRRLWVLLYFGGIFFVYLSVTPMAWYVSWSIYILSALWAIVLLPIQMPSTFRPGLMACTVGIVAVAGVLEYSFWRFPVIPNSDRAIYVIGDSVSSGIGGRDEVSWPIRLQQHLGRPVSNLAIAGATAESAVRQQLPKVAHPDSLVFLEIGGNDLLNHTAPIDFEIAMRDLLDELTRQNHLIFLFELPRLIRHRPHGRLQRCLAREYDITLIPRTFLADIFKQGDLTSDGVHLTQKGHDAFGKAVYALWEDSANVHWIDVTETDTLETVTEIVILLPGIGG